MRPEAVETADGEIAQSLSPAPSIILLWAQLVNCGSRMLHTGSRAQAHLGEALMPLSSTSGVRRAYPSQGRSHAELNWVSCASRLQAC
jgi:hypothetical protein